MRHLLNQIVSLAILACGFCFVSPAHAQIFLGKSGADWLKEMQNSDSEAARRNAAFALGKMGHAPALPALAQRLTSDKGAKVREAAAFAMGEIGGKKLGALEDPNLVPALINGLKDADPLVRRSSACALGQLSTDDKRIEGALEAAILDDRAEVRQNVAWALGRIGSGGVPALRKALGDADAFVKRDAANSLAIIEAPAARPALNDLAVLCAEKNSEVRRAALAALVRIVGPDDAAVAPTIAQALADRDPEVRCNAALVLCNIGGKEAAAAVDELLKALRKGDLELRRQAAVALSRIGPEAKAAVPDLIQALRDADVETRAHAAMALGGVGKGAEKAFPALVELVASDKEQPEVRVNAAVALSKIGDVPAAVKAVPTLLAILEDPRQDYRVRARVVWALRVHNVRLRTMDGIYPAFTKVVREEPNEDNNLLRYDCAYMLGMLQGPDVPKVVLDVLLEYLKNKKVWIYVGVDAKVQGTGVEAAGGKATVEDVGKGDGRVMAIQALQQVGRARILERRDIVSQLKTLAADLAADPKSDENLRKKTKELLQSIGK
ncbi:MAG: HEAT repeat domain-containing protein [Planctomycetes bacterium]|nr:HEAT repeat domain-containing protein [Planctomycetota bacterium]